MKKVIYSILLLLAINQSKATTYYWIGGLAPTVNYSNNINWTTNAVTRTPIAATGTLVITATDVLVFDGTNLGGTTVVTGAATVMTSGADTFAQLKFLNSANVTFGRTTGGSTRFTLFGDGTAAPDLVVDATSSFTLGGTSYDNNFQLLLDTLNMNATGSIDGKIYLSPLSTNTGVHTRSYITAGVGEMVFNNGAACYVSDSAATSGFNGSTANSFVFKSGASLYYYTGRSVIGSSSTKQFTVFEPGSNYYIRGSNVSYVDGTTAYGSSSWTANKTFANVFIQNGSTYTSDGVANKIEDLTIATGCSFITHTSGQTPVLGNLVVNGTLIAPPAGTTNNLVLGGNLPQTISGTGTISVLSFTVCENSDVTLLKNIVTTGTTVNIVGKLNFGATNNISGTASFISRVGGTASAATGNTVAGSFQITGASALSGNTGLTITGAGIQPNTSVVGFGTGYINLSKPATATATGVALTFASNAATLQTANPNGFDSTNGSVIVTGAKSYGTGTNYIIDAPTTYPIGISSTVTTAMTVGNITLNAPVTTNYNTRVNGAITLNTGKLTIRPTDTIRVFSGSDILGFPFSNSKYIVTANNGSSIGVLRIDTFNTVRAFPVGTATDYLPVKLTPTDFSNFCVSVFQGVTNDGTLAGTAFSAAQKTSIVDAVWVINRSKGTGNSNVDLYWANGLEGSDFANYTNNQIGISRYDGTAWTVSTALSADNTSNFATDGTGTFGSFGVGKLATALPVKLANIKASAKDNSVTISWNAFNEINVEKYTIERSIDGRNFSAIANVLAANNVTEKSYNYIDANLANAIYYYRIKVLDKDGKQQISSVVKIALQTKTSLSVYPNPASNEVVISGIKNGTIIQVVDIVGKIILQEVANSNTQIINISNLTKGFYAIKIIQQNGESNCQSFIKK